VLLTPNEVQHARKYSHVALFALCRIEVGHAAEGHVVVYGGVPRVFQNWSINESNLEPTGYRYRLGPRDEAY
jgi:hypothetical protein